MNLFSNSYQVQPRCILRKDNLQEVGKHFEKERKVRNAEMRKFRKVKALKLKEKQSKMNFPTEVEGVFIWCDLFKMTSIARTSVKKFKSQHSFPKN